MTTTQLLLVSAAVASLAWWPLRRRFASLGVLTVAAWYFLSLAAVGWLAGTWEARSALATAAAALGVVLLDRRFLHRSVERIRARWAPWRRLMLGTREDRPRR